VEQVGTPMELYETPNSVFVAGFIGSPKMNFISGDKAASFNAETVGIRGEHLTIVPSGGTWSGKVIHTENLGADSYVYLEMGTEEPVVVRLDGANTYKSGDTVHISPMEGKVHRFDAAGKPIL
jgi:multiple sugar transport system ATP-binding protein